MQVNERGLNLYEKIGSLFHSEMGVVWVEPVALGRWRFVGGGRGGEGGVECEWGSWGDGVSN